MNKKDNTASGWKLLLPLYLLYIYEYGTAECRLKESSYFTIFYSGYLRILSSNKPWVVRRLEVTCGALIPPTTPTMWVH